MTALERRTVRSLVLLYSFRLLGLFMVLPLLALYATDLPGATPALIGLALGAYGLTQAALQIPLGWLSDQLGRKPVIVAGLTVFVVGSVVAATADDLWGIVIGRALQGAGAIAATVMALLADLTSVEQRTKSMAIVGISIGMSFAISLVVGPAIAAAGGLATVFWVTALLGVGGILIVLFLVPSPTSAPGAHSDVGTRPSLLGRALREPELLRLDFGVFTLHFILMASFLVVPGAIEQWAGVDRAHHWQVYLPVLLLSIVGMALLLRRSERGGRLRGTFLGGIALLAGSILVIGIAASPYALYFGLLLFFTCFNFMEAVVPSQVSKAVFTGGKGTALGIYSTCQFFGTFAGGAAGGWMMQQFGKMGVVALCVGLAGVWFMLALGSGRALLPDPEQLPRAP